MSALGDAIAARAITAFITGKAKGIAKMGVLSGYKTYIVAGLSIAIGVAEIVGVLPQGISGIPDGQTLIWGGVMAFLGRTGARTDAAKAQAGILPQGKVNAVLQAAGK